MLKLLITVAIVALAIGAISLSRISVSTAKPTVIPSGAVPDVSVLADGLDTPWAMVFLPDGTMLVTERPGRIRLIDGNGDLQAEPVGTLTDVLEIGEGGLLGMALHPDFSINHYIYLYYTYAGNGGLTKNRVVRMNYEKRRLSDEETVLDGIPGNSNHDGGRIKFGPDKYLYIATGDSQNPSLAQNIDSLAGKILRITDDGRPAPGNPFGNRVYSYGHRNPQGLAWDQRGRLWSTEHGPSGNESGDDEVNLILAGKNYGWPLIRGSETRQKMEKPVIDSGPSDTWAPAGLAVIGTKIFFAGLRGQALYSARISGDKLIDFRIDYENRFGRLREVAAGRDGMLYVTTSNRDGRGTPQPKDDKIIRVNVSRL